MILRYTRNRANEIHITGLISLAPPSRTLRMTYERIPNMIPFAMEDVKGIMMIAKNAEMISDIGASSNFTFLICDIIRYPTYTRAGVVAKPGIEMKSGAVGEAYFGCTYSQNVADALSQIAKVKLDISLSVVAEALLYLYNENKALRELLAGKDNAVLPVVKAQSVECDDILTLGVPNVLVSSVAGAPSATNVPDNWNEDTMTVWDGCPRKIGQQYVDKASKKVYYAVAVTGSTADWVALN